MVEAHGLEPWFSANRADVLAAGRSLYGAPAENRTPPSALPKLRAASSASGANGAPCPSRTDFYRTQADNIAVNAYRAKPMEPDRRFELRPELYECSILPIELIRLERVGRVELPSLVWKTKALATGRYPLEKYTNCQRSIGRGGETRTHVSLVPGQVGWPLPYAPKNKKALQDLSIRRA